MSEDRFQRVLTYIEDHLDEDLSVEALSSVAAFSKFHFHRRFTALFGVTVHRYVQMERMKRAAYRLAFRTAHTVIDIALECGFESPEAFARAFKLITGQAPTEFRKSPDWTPWQTAYRANMDARRSFMRNSYSPADVKIIDFPETRIAALEHRGDPAGIQASVRRFIEWRKANRLPPKLGATFNILYDGPDSVPPEQFRLDIGAATNREIAPNDAGIVARTIPAGRCAVLRLTGEDIGTAAAYLYADWLPGSGEELRDFPLFCQRVAFFPDVPANDAVTDLFLPLR